MTLTPHTRLGPYQIVGQIGEGGMGVVYRAHDTQLDRDVALKVLPADVVADAERAARFEREAKVLAALNHPNIAQIHGLETSGETRALVMELVEGPTLAERLEHGALPIGECLAIARQIAEALEEAHGKGIVHRDLKPQNVKVSQDGLSEARVKVLDFGLAKAMDPNASASGVVSASRLAASPTLTLGATVQGVILGSAPYMAPEQAKGMAVDKRADIWAFGVVLHEMLTGRRLFEGDSVPETLAGVLKGDIDFDVLPAATPAALRRLLRRCLERNPRNRLHDIADARIVLDELLRGVDDGAPAATHPDGAGVPVAPRRAVALGTLAVAVLATGAAAGLLGYFARPDLAASREPMRLSVQLAARQELVVSGNATLAFSHDGSSLFFKARQNGQPSLFRRVLGEQDAAPIAGTEDAESPFLSRDGRWIGFFRSGKLMKVAIEGGRPFALADGRGSGGATWLADETIVLAPMYSDGLFRLPPQGGALERLSTPDRAAGELGHWWPDPLPGDRRVLFTAFRTPVDRSRIGVLDLDTLEARWLVDGGFFARWSPSGHLLFAKEGRLMAAPFDAESATVTGPAVAVVDDVRVAPTGGWAQFALSSRGALAYVSESVGNPVRELVWLDRDGRVEPAGAEPNRFLSAALSPDDRRVAVTIQQESFDLWIYALASRALSRLTSSPGTELAPVWSSDGSEVFYVVDRPPFELHRIAAGFPDTGRPIWDEPNALDTLDPNVSPDGRTIAFIRSQLETGSDLLSRPLDGSEPVRTIRANREDERSASFSPDSRWVVYQTNETGRWEVYVEPFPGPGERVQISADGGQEPLWAGNGEIFFRRLDEIRVVATSLESGFAAEPPRALFEHPILHGVDEDTRTWDVTADGQRILAVSTPEASRPRKIEIVTDFLSELERRVPTSGTR